MARLRALLVALLAIVLLAALVAPADALFKRKKKKVAGGAKVTKLEPLLKKAKLLSSKNVNVLKKEFLSTKKWKKLQSFGSSVDVRVYSAKPMNVKSPVIVIKEFVLPTAKMGSKDWKKAHDMFEDARNEIAVGSKLNGLPFIARYLGNDAAPEPQENGNKKFRAALFMNKADASMDSLFDAGQPASTDQATRKLIAQMFIAVGVMHWKGYIHRDLKPAQFLIVNGANGERTVRLADFGTAIKNDPKVIWQDTLNQIGTTIADKKTAEIATPGTKAGLPVFENQAYRSPESMKFFEIQDLRQNLVDYYGEAAYARWVIANSGTRPTFKQAKQLREQVAPKIKKALKDLEPAMRKLKKNLYGKPMDYWALGISLWDLYTGYGSIQNPAVMPYPAGETGMSGQYRRPDVTVPIDLTPLDQTVTDATILADLKDLLTKLLDPNPVTRLQDVGTVLAHPFFATAGVDTAQLLQLGIAAAIADNDAIPPAFGTARLRAGNIGDAGRERGAPTQGDDEVQNAINSLSFDDDDKGGLDDTRGEDLNLLAVDPDAQEVIQKANSGLKLEKSKHDDVTKGENLDDSSSGDNDDSSNSDQDDGTGGDDPDGSNDDGGQDAGDGGDGGDAGDGGDVPGLFDD